MRTENPFLLFLTHFFVPTIVQALLNVLNVNYENEIRVELFVCVLVSKLVRKWQFSNSLWA